MSQTKTKSTAKDLIAGGTAGGIEAFLMYPTEYVKTQMQLAERAAGKGGKPVYTNPIQCARVIVAEKGFLSLYRGMSTLLIGSIPKAAVRFGAFNEFSKLLKDEKGKMSPTSNMLAGLGAGISEAIIAVTPMETVKTKFINDQNLPQPKYKGLVHGVGEIVKAEGIAGVYAGVVPTMMKQGTNQMVRFTVYNQIKDMLVAMKAPGAKKDLSLPETFGGGAVAGFVSVYATMPFDVVKTRMQGLDAKKYSGTLDCFNKVLQNEGVLALWKGTTPRLGRVCFSGAIIFAAYEQVLKTINVFWPEPK